MKRVYNFKQGQEFGPTDIEFTLLRQFTLLLGEYYMKDERTAVVLNAFTLVIMAETKLYGK